MIKPTYKTLLSERNFLKVQQRARELRKYGTHLVNIFYDDSRLIFKTRSSTGDPRLIWTQTVELADIDIDQLIKMNGKIDYRTFLLTGLRVDCNCYAFLYYGYRYMAWKRGYGLVKETRIPRVRNPYQKGFVCKHLYLVLSCLPFLAQTLQSKFGKYISKRKQELAAQQKKQDSVLRQKVQQVINPVYDADLRYQQQVQQAVQARQELDKLQAPQYDLLNPEASAEEQRPQVQPQQYPQNTPDYDPNLDLEPDFSDEDEESIYKIIQEDNGQ